MKERLKKLLPPSLKYSLKYLYGVIPPRFRYGKVFWETYNFLQESQWWSREKLEEYQMQQITKLLNHAYENVPYYRKVFDERGLKPGGIQNFDELKKLPYLTKEIIQKNLPDLIAQNYPKSKLQYVTTGGSTGIPLGFYHEKAIQKTTEWAFMVTQWKRVGFKLSDKRVELRGSIVRSAVKDKFWEYNPIHKTLILSSYYMTDAVLPRYIEKIRDFHPDFIHVYPSTITILAKFMKENNIKPFHSVKALLCGSENFYPWQRELLEDVFKCRAYSWYGHSEQAVLAGECEKSSYYHIFPEYGLVEIIDESGNPVNEEGKAGEIIATGFNNYAMPFIRYRTMDLGVYTNQECSCGRKYPLLKRVEGRMQEYFVDKTGSLITFICADEVLWSVKGNINAYQYVQDEPGKVLLNIDAKTRFPLSDIEKVRRSLDKYYSRLDIEIKFVNNIPRTKSGKFRFLIQKLPIEFGEI
jgi:phenylacetate-CoA ligase